MRRLAVLLALLLWSTGCIDASRVNRRCAWVEASSQRLDLSKAADREHLRMDAQLAADLGVRSADAQFRSRPDAGDLIQRECTGAMTDTIARRHGVPRARVVEAFYYRVWWADLLAVYLPVAALVVLAMDIIVRRIWQFFDPEDRGAAIASATAFVAVIALMGLGVGQLWGFTMEGVFVRNAHVAYRASHVPLVRHGWIGYFSFLGLCSVVAVRRAARTTLRRIEPSYASYLGAPARRPGSM